MQTKYLLGILACAIFFIPGTAEAYILDVEFNQENYLVTDKVKFAGSTIQLGDKSDPMVYYEIFDPTNQIIQKGNLLASENRFNGNVFLGNSNLVLLGEYTLTVSQDRNVSSYSFDVINDSPKADYILDFADPTSSKSIIIKRGESVEFKTENRVFLDGTELKNKIYTFESTGFHSYIVVDLSQSVTGRILVTP